jgi:F-box protein 42
MHVLDISRAIDDHIVTWVELRSNANVKAPKETILYSLVAGQSELIMFGGIQKDVSSMNMRTQPSPTDSVSNSVYFLETPKNLF